MENLESETTSPPEESSALNRNRSFKSKQLVRSQAIRESQSPPRTGSPSVSVEEPCTDTDTGNTGTGNIGTGNIGTGHGAVATESVEVGEKRRPVEIHITGGAWESGEQRNRRRWPQQSRDLLSNGPRVACVAGCRSQCRGQRRRNPCPTKQDSGISCPDECTDCSDFEHTGGSTIDVRKAHSLDSDESYCRCPDKKEKPKTNSLSRTDSADEKIEPTGPELVNFIKETLNKNARDRMLLLMIEKELHALVTDTGRCNYKFPGMTSYGRMLVHRVATLFQLTHHLDQSSKNSVTVSKSGTSGGRIPCTSFKQWCTVNFPPSPVRHQDSINAKSILKRDAHSPDANASCRAVERSKSLEQRERDYERARRRIFSTDNCSQDESQWPWLQTGPVKLLTPDAGRNKLLKVQSLEGAGPPQSWRARGAVSKSHSFGGYGGGAEPAPQPRLLSRQGDLASSSWRLSPSSSGYKTLSLRSTDSVTPSPTGGASPEPGAESVVFAVADLACVPPGALVIHPQTGRPLTNPDGSVYHFDPQNPPVIYDTSSYQELKIQNCEKRRGRLEKQHSFIDSEAECRCDDGRSKCCCECRRHDSCSQRTNEKISVPPEQKTTPISSSPIKNRYEQNAEAVNNQGTPLEPAANHGQAYDAAAARVAEPTNQGPEIQAFEPATNQVAYEQIQRTEYDPNQRTYESPNQRVFENRTFEASPHQRPPSYDPLANQRAANENVTNHMAPMNKLAKQESVEAQYVPQLYHKGYRTDEVTSPPQLVQNQMVADVAVYNVMAQAKVTPVPVPDPNLRPVSLTNMLFPAPVAQGYPYVNQVRMDQPLHPMYQPVMEEQKLAPSPHNDTFRIDPSYTYAYPCAACAGACLDPHQHQRPYSLGYGQLDQQMLQQPYQVGNMLLQHNMQHYPYADAMQWGSPMIPGAPPKLLMHELCPVYPQYPYMYPQMIPQPYPIMQPIYPVMDKDRRPRRANTLPQSQRTTPQPRDRRDSEIALKIQQIKDQMAQMNTQDKEKSGNGLLGSAPANYNGRVGRPVNDETQLSSAARAIVNSIRSMQANTNQHDPRRQMGERDRRDERDDKRRPHRQVTSPPQLVQNPMVEDMAVYNVMAQAEVTPVPVPDPNLRPVSLTNMLFPAPVAQGYPYVNQVRMDQPLHPMYQPVMEEQKLAPSPHNDTFRIDPSYTYAYPCAACAGACLDPHQHQRPYSLGYGQLDQQMLQQPYQVGNMLLQHNMQHYPYADAMQWGSPMMPGAPPKLLMHELCPVYPQYPYMYPQMIAQPYPIMQPIYPVMDKDRRPRRANTLPQSQRTTPQPRDRRDSEIALKIQQIKDQMAQMNTQDKEKSGNGLLGSAPANYNGRVGRPVNDETQLSSAARAIVNSIRSMQANTNQHDPRRQMGERDRRDERDDKRRPHRQMSPGNWCRRSPGPVHPAMNQPRRPHPDTRSGRR